MGRKSERGGGGGGRGGGGTWWPALPCLRGEKEVCETRLGPYARVVELELDRRIIAPSGRTCSVLVHGCGCGYVTAGSCVAPRPINTTEASCCNPNPIHSTTFGRSSDHIDLFITVIYLHFCHRHNNLGNETKIGSSSSSKSVLRKNSTGERSTLPWSAPEFIEASYIKEEGPSPPLESIAAVIRHKRP